jgi:hypothetical protein
MEISENADENSVGIFYSKFVVFATFCFMQMVLRSWEEWKDKDCLHILNCCW